MPHYWFRSNLSSAIFPFESDFAGRTIIMAQYDENFDRVSNPNQKDRGIPQAMYMHNVLPTSDGYRSVGYDTRLAGYAGASDFDSIFTLEYTSPNIAKFLYSPAKGKQYVFDANVGAWAIPLIGGYDGTSYLPNTTGTIAAATTYVDETWKLSNNLVISSVGCYCSTAGKAVQLLIVQQTSAGNYTVINTLASATHPGGGWADFAVAYTVPATGNYYVAVYLGTGTFDLNTGITGASIAGLAVGAQAWSESTSLACPALRCTSTTSIATKVNATAYITTALVNGITFVCIQGSGVFIYNQVSKKLDTVVLAGITASSLLGICAANGYMIAFSSTQVLWSNTTNPTDFVPSLVTGAGGGSVQYADGAINFCLSIAGGFMVYCENNVVSASYSANVRYPYTFAPVAGSGGCVTPEQVSWQSNLSMHYAWTSAGIQELTRTSAKLVHNQVTDFLTAQVWEDFDETSLLFTQKFLSTPLYMKVAAVAERFLVFSYGTAPNLFSHAIVYDIALERYGKIKLAHTDVFEWNAPNLYGPITYGMLASNSYADLVNTTYGQAGSTGANIPKTPMKTFALVQQDGTIQTVCMNFSGFNAVGTPFMGVLMIGKYEFIRTRYIVHQRTDVECVSDFQSNFKFYIIPTMDGKTLLTPQQGILISEGNMTRRYGLQLTCLNFTTMFMGAFWMSSILIDFTPAGDY